jgi:hypothetical protein
MVDKMLHVFERNSNSYVWADEPMVMGSQHAGNVLAIQTEIPYSSKITSINVLVF